MILGTVRAEVVWGGVVRLVSTCSTEHRHSGAREQRDCYTTGLYALLERLATDEAETALAAEEPAS